MEISNEQKALKVFSIISLVFGIIALVFGVMMIVGGGIAAGKIEEITSDTAATAEQVGEFSALFIVTGLFTIFSAVTNIIDWILLKRVSKDATKYKPAWIVTLCSVILSCLQMLTTIFGQNKTTQDYVNAIVALALNGIIFYLINKVKQSVIAATAE
ncbi:MAG: hypothetical protein IKD94_06950 [Erysipelotrichaceae bacterium]|nr:hypothetical protein [Erysipelotrichaceae bacterium]